MPVDLDALPAKMQLPASPRIGRGLLFILVFTLLCGALVAVFWSAPDSYSSTWFWCSVLVLPLLGGIMLFSIRLLMHEQRRDYAQNWNDSHDEHEGQLIERGQRAIAMLAASYVCDSGSSKLAQTLRAGQQVSPAQETNPQADFDCPAREDERERRKGEHLLRLATSIERVLAGFEADMQDVLNDASLHVRIRHCVEQSQDEVEALWRSIRGALGARDQVAFAVQEDGLLWLDAWLDDGFPARACLSLEINRPSEPGDGQGESVSAILLAHTWWCAEKGLRPQSWIHRPVKLTRGAADIRRALLWGKVPPDSADFFIWHSQLPEGITGVLSVDLHESGQSPPTDAWHSLDGSFGKAGAAVGNTTLIVAAEQALVEARPQLILLHDHSTQACVVQPG